MYGLTSMHLISLRVLYWNLYMVDHLFSPSVDTALHEKILSEKIMCITEHILFAFVLCDVQQVNMCNPS